LSRLQQDLPGRQYGQDAGESHRLEHLKIRAEGEHLQVWLNGKRTADVHDTTSDSGKIGFQVHPGADFGPMKIVVREATIREL
jgi:hypothetical protein